MKDDDDRLPMDQVARPELVTEPRITEPEREPEPEKVLEPANVEVDERESGKPRDEHGRFAKAETGVKEPAPEPEPETPSGRSDNVPLKALEDERRKRQDMERELAAIRQQMQQAQAQQLQEPVPEFWDDPDRAIDTRVSAAVNQALAAFQHQQTLERLNASEAAVKARHADADDALRGWLEAVNVNPTLNDQMLLSPDPGEFAYKAGKNWQQVQQVGSIDDLLKAERAKWEAELKASAPAPSFPQSTVHDGTVAPRGAAFPLGNSASDITLPMDRRYR